MVFNCFEQFHSARVKSILVAIGAANLEMDRALLEKEIDNLLFQFLYQGPCGGIVWQIR